MIIKRQAPHKLFPIQKIKCLKEGGTPFRGSYKNFKPQTWCLPLNYISGKGHIMNTKEVWFWDWCPKCKYCDLKESEDPCDDCLSEPSNEDSHKPVYFKEKENA